MQRAVIRAPVLEAKGDQRVLHDSLGSRKWHDCPEKIKPASHCVPKQAGAGMYPWGGMGGVSQSLAVGSDFVTFLLQKSTKGFGI